MQIVYDRCLVGIHYHTSISFSYAIDRYYMNITLNKINIKCALDQVKVSITITFLLIFYLDKYIILQTNSKTCLGTYIIIYGT